MGGKIHSSCSVFKNTPSVCVAMVVTGPKHKGVQILHILIHITYFSSTMMLHNFSSILWRKKKSYFFL